jgi:hypothetical protein
LKEVAFFPIRGGMFCWLPSDTVQVNATGIFVDVSGWVFLSSERRVTYHTRAGALAAQMKVVHLHQLAFWAQLTFPRLITFYIKISTKTKIA